MKLHRVGMLAVGVVALGVLAAGSQPPDRGNQPPQKKDGPRGGPGGPGGPGGLGGPPRFQLGKVLPPPLMQQLDLTADQQKAIAALEQEVKQKLSKILTAEQLKKAEEFRPMRRGDGPPDGRGDRPGRPERPGQGDRPERPQRPERPDAPPSPAPDRNFE